MWIRDSGDETLPAEVVGNIMRWNDDVGVYAQDSYISILGNHIYENYAFSSAGGIDLWECYGIVAGNLIEGNEGFAGGGIYTRLGSLGIANNVVAGNLADYGGGVRLRGEHSFDNNTVAGNEAVVRGGGADVDCDSVALQNCIFWENTAPLGPEIYLADVAGPTIATVLYCDVEGGQDSIELSSGATLIWGPGNIDEDPLFESGPLSDYHLSSGSPCIDAGNPDSQYNDPEDPMNPGYALWPALGGLRNDMGAYGGGGVGYWVGIEEGQPPTPSDGLTLRVFPNPLRGSATLVFELAQPGPADLRVYDLSGRLIQDLFSGDIVSGPMSCWLDGSRLPSGVYLASVRSGDQSKTVRLVKL
jgi:hypothetical protein